MDNQQESTVEHMKLCSMLCGNLDGRGVWGRMDTCICMAESLFCSPETITIMLISFTLVQNLKKKKLKDRLSQVFTIIYLGKCIPSYVVSFFFH